MVRFSQPEVYIRTTTSNILLSFLLSCPTNTELVTEHIEFSEYNLLVANTYAFCKVIVYWLAS